MRNLAFYILQIWNSTFSGSYTLRRALLEVLQVRMKYLYFLNLRWVCSKFCTFEQQKTTEKPVLAKGVQNDSTFIVQRTCNHKFHYWPADVLCMDSNQLHEPKQRTSTTSLSNNSVWEHQISPYITVNQWFRCEGKGIDRTLQNSLISSVSVVWNVWIPVLLKFKQARFVTFGTENTIHRFYLNQKHTF